MRHFSLPPPPPPPHPPPHPTGNDWQNAHTYNNQPRIESYQHANRITFSARLSSSCVLFSIVVGIEAFFSVHSKSSNSVLQDRPRFRTMISNVTRIFLTMCTLLWVNLFKVHDIKPCCFRSITCQEHISNVAMLSELIDFEDDLPVKER